MSSVVTTGEPFFRQLRLHPSGASIWSREVVAGGSSYIAYASTLSVYVYSVGNFALVRLLGGNTHNIVSLIWHPVEDGILCVWTADGRGSIWNVKSGDRMSSVHIKGATPVAGAWEPSGGYIAVAAKEGHVHIWDAAAAGTTTSIVVAPHVPPRRPTSLQWNPKSNGRIRRLLVGWEDGGLLTVRRSSTGKWVVEPVPTPSLSKAKPSPVLAVEWDPLSGVYALVAHICGLLVLWDMDKLEPAGSPAERRVPSLVAARWLPWAPGNFVTFSSKSMLAKVWNVSQLDPVSSFRLSGGAGGISSAAVLTRSGKGGLLLAAMMDGTIVLYNTKTRQLEWSSLPGHTETIFGVAFSPSTPDVIATCSYDGSTKIWHTPTMDLKLTLANQGGIIYTVCWSSGDGHLIATGNSKGSVWFWDGTSGKVIRRLDLHTKPVYKICWEGPLLASVSADKLCIVFDSSGTVIRQYRQPCEMYGCDWCPFRPHILAAGGEDGTVRVYDTSKHSASPIMSLKGHTARVFSVIWSPLLHHRLASGSDDRSIRIWQITDEQLNSGNHIMVQKDSLVLSGHSSHVRPLVWSTEVPWLILSGSWDGTVRAWDIRGTGKCIAIMTQHIADVYGLAIHPQRPFVVVSASRDTTMRYSSLEGIVGSAKVRAVFHGSLMRSLGSVEDEMQEPCGTPGLLCGKASQLAAEDLDTFRSSCLLVDLYQRMFNFFGGPDGLDELWTMVRALTGAKCTSPSLIHSSGLDLETERITYRDDLIPKAEALARHLAGPGVFMHRDERMRKDERLERAASLHLFSGDLVGYCELSIKRGMFDHALSLAAGISREYWLELMERRLHQMMEDGEGAEDAVPLMLAAGKVDDAMDRLVQKSDLGPALTVGVAASRGAFHCAKLAKNEAGENKESPSPPTRRTSRPAHESSTEKVVEHISAGRASTFYHYSQPLLGASSLLSIGQIDAAIAMLTAGNEMEVAYAVAQSLRLPIHHTEPLVVELAMQADRLNDLPLAIGLLEEARPAAQVSLLVIARHAWLSGDPKEAAVILAGQGLQTPQDYAAEASSIKGTSPEAVVYWLLAGEWEEAASNGAELLLEALDSQPRDMRSLAQLATIVGSIPAYRLSPGRRTHILALAAMSGLLLAMEAEYCSVIAPMCRHAMDLIEELHKASAVAPMDGREIFKLPSELQPTPLCLSCARFLRSRNQLLPAAALLNLLDNTADAVDPKKVELGETAVAVEKSKHSMHPDEVIPAGSLLPSASKAVYCTPLWQPDILPSCGPFLLLEDGLRGIPYGTAIMWSKVNHFSPLGTGHRMELP